jgi:hypothetical protein
MGGPLATSPISGTGFHGAYSVSSLERYETDAPYDKWRKLGSFASQQGCEAVRAAQIKQGSDPAWIAKHGPPSSARPDPAFMRDFFGMAKCVGGDALSAVP